MNIPDCPPAPRRHPAPANFSPRQQIGEIAGAPVLGCAGWCEIAGTESRFDVVVELAGLTLRSDGRHLLVDGVQDADGLPLRDVAALAELWQAGAVQQLAALARSWLAGPALASAAD